MLWGIRWLGKRPCYDTEYKFRLFGELFDGWNQTVESQNVDVVLGCHFVSYNVSKGSELDHLSANSKKLETSAPVRNSSDSMHVWYWIVAHWCGICSPNLLMI
jgi:hypothetical protein